jgi:hypothetical protein
LEQCVQIDMMPAETIGGVQFPAYPASWLVEALKGLEEAAAQMRADPRQQRRVAELKALGMLPLEFEL